MNRKILSDFVSNDMSITKTDAKLAVDSVISGILDGLLRGEKISLMGLGTFYTLNMPERNIRNPKTGEQITISPKKVIKFKASKLLKKELNK
ncbi:MAG TPA: HU family DNA-binding protein [Bacteroidales bacterium]|nr:HU family DNA-binding protein [Bacteroidales bacterium]